MKKILVMGVFALSASATALASPNEATVRECNGVLTFRIPTGGLKRPKGTGRGVVVDISNWRFTNAIEKSLYSDDEFAIQQAARGLAVLPGGDHTVLLYKEALQKPLGRPNALVAFRSWVEQSDATASDITRVLKEVLDQDFTTSEAYDSLVTQMATKVVTWDSSSWKTFIDGVASSENPNEKLFFVDVLKRYETFRPQNLDETLNRFEGDEQITKDLQKIKSEIPLKEQVWFENKYQNLGLSGMSQEKLSVLEWKEKFNTALNLTEKDFELGLHSLNPTIKRATTSRLGRDLDSDSKLKLFGSALRDPSWIIQGIGIEVLSNANDENFQKIVSSFLEREKLFQNGTDQSYYTELLNVIGQRIFERPDIFGKEFVLYEIESQSSVLQDWGLKTLYKLPDQNLAKNIVRIIVKKYPQLKGNLFTLSRDENTPGHQWVTQALRDEIVVPINQP